MQPAPLAGTATSNHNLLGLLLSRGCNPHPSRGRQLNPKEMIIPKKIAMQPAPLAGTATVSTNHFVVTVPCDATRTPRGDSNASSCVKSVVFLPMQPAPLTGTATHPGKRRVKMRLQDAARAPHGDNNPWSTPVSYRRSPTGCNPHPSRGRQPERHHLQRLAPCDATRTPRGDGNICTSSRTTIVLRCNPHPSRGRQLTPASPLPRG